MKSTKDGIEFECDRCGEVLETATKVFTEAVDKLKTEWWRVRWWNEEAGWQHYCPKCNADA